MKRAVALLLSFTLLAASCVAQTAVPAQVPSAVASAQTRALGGLEKINHFVFIIMENRSFDHYFGTFPGADGLPRDAAGNFTSCNPLPPGQGDCVKPFHNPRDLNWGGAIGGDTALKDINGGKMDGFATQQLAGAARVCDRDPVCVTERIKEHDVMGYHDEREIPNYWAYAKSFALHDRFFQADRTWSLTAHLYAVSGWSARCSSRKAESCVADDENPGDPRITSPNNAPFAWTDVTHLLHKAGVSWAYYLDEGPEPDCVNEEMNCGPEPVAQQRSGTPSIWNPLPSFVDVQENGQVEQVQHLDHYFSSIERGTLPNVSWIAPNAFHSDHPGSSIDVGAAFVTHAVNAIADSPYWADTAIFVFWDDWGGFFDHVPPPSVDSSGYGIRVPALTISAYAKSGYIDKQTLSSDAYLKLVEDRFLSGARLDPQTDGRPDPRSTVRENVETLGDLRNVFDFNAPARPPLHLDPYPHGTRRRIPGAEGS